MRLRAATAFLLLLSGPAAAPPLAAAAVGSLNDPGAVEVHVEPSTTKVDVDAAKPSAAAASSIDIAAQRGECESVQLVVRPVATSLRNVSVTFAPLTGGAASFPAADHWTARQQGYVYCDVNSAWVPSVQQSPGWQPDPLLRLDLPDSGTDLASADARIYPNWRRGGVGVIPFIPTNKSQSIWLTVCVPRNATPGTFQGEFSVDGVLGDAMTAWVPKPVAVKLEIWPLVLPEVGDPNTLGTAFIWLEPTITVNWTRDCYRNGNASLYRSCSQRDEWFAFLKRNRIPPNFGGTLGSGAQSLESYVAARDIGGSKWMQLLAVSDLGGPCACKSNHACNYTDE